MQTRLFPFALAILLLHGLIAHRAHAQLAIPPAGVGGEPVAVLHIDLTRFDPQAFAQTLIAVQDAIPRTEQTAPIRMGAVALRVQAAGRAQMVYNALSQTGATDVLLLMHEHEGRILIKAGPDADPQALERALSMLGEKFPPPVAPLADGWFVASPFPVPEITEQGQHFAAHFSQLFNEAEPEAVRFVLHMPDDMKTHLSQWFAENPHMPQEALAEGWPIDKFKHMVASLRLGDEPQLRFVTHFEDAPAAQAYLDWTAAMVDYGRTNLRDALADASPEVREALPSDEQLDAMRAVLTETREEAATILHIGMEEVRLFMQFMHTAGAIIVSGLL